MSILKWLIKQIHNVDVDTLLKDTKRVEEENGINISRVRSLQTDKSILNRTIIEKQEQLESLNRELSEEKEKNTSLMKTVCEQNKELGKLRQTKEVNEEKIRNLTEDTNKLKVDIKLKDDEIKKLKEQLTQSPGTPSPESDDESQDQIESLTRTVQSLQFEIQKLTGENRKIKGDLSNRNSTIDELKKEIANKQNEIDSYKEAQEPVNKDNSNSEIVDDEPLEKADDKLSDNTTDDNTDDELDGEPPIEIEETQGVAYLPDGDVIPIIDFDKTKRTIDTVLDLEENKIISAKQFFSHPESYIFKMRTELEKAIYLQKPKYVCKYCGQMVKISGRKTQRGVARFFSHLRDSEDCDYKTTTGRTKREIEREKYARCNEGERHKYLKAEIAKYLEMTEGVTHVQKESTIKGHHPILRWRRPDVFAKYKGLDVVFELQLSTTFVSVIAERDLFYRLNKTHIIWVFNFDEQAEHVDLTNMMTKDVYYNNHFNIFIFDREAQEKSEQEGELYLKCNWIGSDGKWVYKNGNTSDDIHGELIPLSKMHFDNTYKPYYVNAEDSYYSLHPEIKIEIKSIEDENKEILRQLDILWEREKEELNTKVQKTEEHRKALVEDFEIDEDKIKKETTTYLIAERLGKWGFLTFDGKMRIPFEYEKIVSHTGWIECYKSSTIDIYDKYYQQVESDIKRIEKLTSSFDKYVKETDGDWLWGILKQGLPVSKPIYSRIDIWSENKFIAIRNGLYCIVSSDGTEQIADYDYIGILEDNKAVIEKDGKKGYIDGNCEIIDFDEIQLGDYSKICKLGLWGIRDKEDKMVVPCVYDEIGSIRDALIGVKDLGFNTIIENDFQNECPIKVEFLSRNERKMLIFKVGKREAFMNLRQQQKARKNGLDPLELNTAYISHTNTERNLLYLSATPVKGPVPKKALAISNSDISLGTVLDGAVVHVDRNSVIIKSDKGDTAYIHRSTWGGYTMETFNKAQRLRVEKIGFDNNHKKHIWRIVSAYYSL